VIGYWPDIFEERGIPDYLIKKYDKDIKGKIVNYLNSGVLLFSEFGHSFCRINCGIPDNLMGSGDLTDGVWSWPEGLAHYVEAHDILLPDDFLDSIKSKNYAFTATEDTMGRINLIKQNLKAFLYDNDKKDNMDMTYWNNWLNQKESNFLANNNKIHYIKMTNSNNKINTKAPLNIPGIKK